MFKILKKIFLISILLLMVVASLFCQNKNKIDSLYNTAIKEKSAKIKALIFSQIAEEYYFNAPDSAIKYCYVGMGISLKTNDISDLAYFHTFLGVLYKNIAVYDSAIYHFNKSVELNKKDNFEKGVAANLSNLGKVLLLKGNYDKALKSYFSSLQIFEKYKDTLNIGELHSNIGGLLVEIKEYKSAEEHFMISKKQYKLAGVELQEAWILYDLGNIKMQTEKLDSAIIYFKESAIVWNKFNRIKDYNNCMLRIGEILIKQKKYQNAEFIFVNANKKFEEINYKKGVTESLLLLGRVQYHQQKYNYAINNISKSLIMSEELQLNGLEIDANFDLYYCYKSLHQFDKALQFHEKYLKLKDSVFNKDKNKLLAEYQTKLDLLNKEVVIKELEDSKQKQLLVNENISIENKQKQKSIYFLIIGIVIILSFLYMLYKRNKANIILNKELNLSLKEREVLIREVHHRVKNNLQIISSLLNLQSENTEITNPKEILKISQSRIEAMSMIHENLYKSSKLSEINFKDYIENLCSYIGTSFSLTEKDIIIELDIDVVKIEIDQLVPCGLIINELVTNSIKHAFSNQKSKIIKINCKNKKGTVNIVISDNGKGIPSEFEIKKSNSLGLRLANGLAKQLMSNLVIENDIGFKASFEFKNKINDN